MNSNVVQIDQRTILKACAKAFLVSGEPTNPGRINGLLRTFAYGGNVEDRGAIVLHTRQNRKPIKEIDFIKGLILPRDIFDERFAATVSLLKILETKEVNTFMKEQAQPALVRAERQADEPEKEFIILPRDYLQETGLYGLMYKLGTNKLKRGQFVALAHVFDDHKNERNPFNLFDPKTYTEPNTPFYCRNKNYVCDVEPPTYMTPLVDQTMTVFDCPQKDNESVKAATVLTAIEHSEKTRRWVAAQLEASSSVYIMADSETVTQLRNVQGRKRSVSSVLKGAFNLSKPLLEGAAPQIRAFKFPDREKVFLATNDATLARHWNAAQDVLVGITQDVQEQLTAPSSGMHNE